MMTSAFINSLDVKSVVTSFDIFIRKGSYKFKFKNVFICLFFFLEFSGKALFYFFYFLKVIFQSNIHILSIYNQYFWSSKENNYAFIFSVMFVHRSVNAIRWQKTPKCLVLLRCIPMAVMLFCSQCCLSDDIQSMSVFAVILPKASLVFAEVIVHVQQPDGDNMSNTWTLKTITLSFYAA